MLTPRYIMVGGFLGAGKTTAILRLAEHLRGLGERVGLITNDQSINLVDTAMLGSHGFATEEITGGCFCCKFNSLVEAAEKLRGEAQPSVFLAEPVGSCTDLRATVAYPLAQMYGQDYSIAPFSVLLDPVRAQRILGLRTGRTFSKKVVYIYEKQLEEADIIVINKRDLLPSEDLGELTEALRQRWPEAHVLAMSARGGQGIVEWFDVVTQHGRRTGSAMEVDYDTYAEGEALLGWLNLQAQLQGPEFDGNRWLLDLAADLKQRLREQDAEIAHLKMTLTPTVGQDLAVANLVQGEGEPELSHELAEPLDEGGLLLNLRAEAAPDILRTETLASLRHLSERAKLDFQTKSLEAFRPGRPTPTYRVTP